MILPPDGVCTQWLSAGPTGDRRSAWISNAISNFSGTVASVGKVKCSSCKATAPPQRHGVLDVVEKYTYCPLFFWNIFRGLKTPGSGQKMLRLIFFVISCQLYHFCKMCLMPTSVSPRNGKSEKYVKAEGDCSEKDRPLCPDVHTPVRSECQRVIMQKGQTFAPLYAS